MEKRIDNIEENLIKKIEEEVKLVKEEFSLEIAKVINRLDGLESRVNNYGDRQKALSNELNHVKYRIIDQEARSRRNNILFYGIAESATEEAVTVVESFIEDTLGIGEEVVIQRAHRVGKQVTNKTRPLIALLRDYPDVELIMKQGKKLANTDKAIGRDYPLEIRQARAKLQGPLKQNKKDGKKAWIAYPAKLLVEGEVFHDEFKDWNEVIYGKA
jgi:hypothetical protein